MTREQEKARESISLANHGYQVRALKQEHGWVRMEVVPDDPSLDADQRVVLVCGEIPEYRVIGWLLARDGKQEQWRANGRLQRDGYIVPQTALISGLPEAVA